ncbi:MAG: sensor histidine kinase [Planctomycetes bacterium]|jgi:two-component system NtrC family sensor kinase|nr:sensor histidine kinase [Planctomycetota bacterium]
MAGPADTTLLRTPEPGLRPFALYRNVLSVLLLGSLIPLAFLGAGAFIVFGNVIADRTREHLETLVSDHAKTVDLFLGERLAAIRLVAHAHRRDTLTAPGRLALTADRLNETYPGSFIDVGIIGADGSHLAYEGPYPELRARNYRDAEWFRIVLKDGQFISDVFLGFRQDPHFIMAVRQDDPDGTSWILRATVNPEVFGGLVTSGRLGETGDCFLVDRQGRYQTRPADGTPLLSPSGLDPAIPRARVETVTSGGKEYLRTTRPVLSGRWLLVAQQEEREALAPVRRELMKGLLVFAAAALVIVLTAHFATRFLVGRIEKGARRAEELSASFLHASKLASIGEMATGLAHEINNPLAIISSEQTNIADLLGELPVDDRTTEMKDSVARSKRQVERCKTITGKMLQFGRQGIAVVERIDPAAQLAEIVRLMRPQAVVSNIELVLDLAPDLPSLRMDSGELQQVVTNLVNNAMQAMPEGGAIRVIGRCEGPELTIAVEDEGTGIPEELRQKIFEPFFTTKPVHKGTGLGLSVCFGIVTKWGGSIRAENRPQGGARFVVRLPVNQSEGPREGREPTP